VFYREEFFSFELEWIKGLTVRDFVRGGLWRDLGEWRESGDCYVMRLGIGLDAVKNDAM
jgi:hypothetical protein